jgi:hypothetical protein
MTSPPVRDPEEERGYLYQQAELGDATLPRARYILDQHQAILPDTPFNRGCLRAVTEYIRELEAADGLEAGAS